MTENTCRRSRWIAGALLVGVAGASLGSIRVEGPRARHADPRSLEGRVVPVARYQPQPGYRVERSYLGTLVPGRRVRLAFQVDGRLTELAADVGSRVEAGTPLARLDDRELRARVSGAEAGLRQARARLDQLRAGPRAETLRAARAEVAAVEAELELARKEDERQARLGARAAATRAEADRARHGLEITRARLEAARARLDELESGTRPEELAAARAAVAAAEARLEQARIARDRASLTAPFTGTIRARLTDEGRVLAPGEPVLELVEDQVLEARIGVPVGLARSLEPGSVHLLRVGPLEYRARLRAPAPEVEPRTRKVTLVLDPLEGERWEHHPGELVRLVHPHRVPEPGAWLPRTALTEGIRGLWAVLRLAPEGAGYRLERAPVEVLHSDRDRAFVRAALAPGDRVVASGVHRVVSGDRAVPAGERP